MTSSLLISEAGLGGIHEASEKLGTSASHDATWAQPAIRESAGSGSARAWNLALNSALCRQVLAEGRSLPAESGSPQRGKDFPPF